MDFTKLIDNESEAILLGTMMCSVNAVNNAMDMLSELDFYNPDHRRIYRAIQKLYRQDHEVERDAVFNVIAEDVKNFKAGYLFGLTTLSTSGEGLYQIEKLKELSRLRSMYVQTLEASEFIKAKNGTSEEIAAKLAKDLDAILTDQKSPEQTFESVIWENYRDTGEPFWQHLDKRMEMARQGLISFDGIPTLYPLLDSALNGLNNGHFIVIGARPAVGKTTFLINLMRNLTFEQKLPVAFFSLEMSADEVALNLICQQAEVSSKNVRAGIVTPIEHSRIIGAAHELRDIPLHIDAQPALRISQLIARAKRHVSVNGVKLILIDYLTLITGDVRYSNKQEEVAETSKALRAMAKKLNVPVICLCQLNRESEKDKRAPTKADLRESGQIEQDAHSILMLHRPDLYDPNHYPGQLRVHIVKNRFGEERTISYNFNKSTGVISEMADIKSSMPDIPISKEYESYTPYNDN